MPTQAGLSSCIDLNRVIPSAAHALLRSVQRACRALVGLALQLPVAKLLVALCARLAVLTAAHGADGAFSGNIVVPTAASIGNAACVYLARLLACSEPAAKLEAAKAVLAMAVLLHEQTSAGGMPRAADLPVAEAHILAAMAALYELREWQFMEAALGEACLAAAQALELLGVSHTLTHACAHACMGRDHPCMHGVSEVARASGARVVAGLHEEGRACKAPLHSLMDDALASYMPHARNA